MIESRIVATTLTAIALACFAGTPARTLESAWTEAQQSSVRLVAAGPVAAGDARLRAGVEIRLSPGWHTYWRYPGDAGVPPRFDWRGSENLGAVEVLWPAPKRIIAGGAISIGYEDGLIFPVRLLPADPKRPVKLSLKIEYAVCERLCVPAEALARLQVPVGGDAKSVALDQAEQRVPRRARVGEKGELAILGVEIEHGATPRALVAVAARGDFDLFAEGPDERWALAVPERIAGTEKPVRFAIPLDGAPPGAGPIPSKLRLTLVSGPKAIEVEAPLD
jgi:DsbC/DsbD-like thiol-disulfide interchange protein